MIALPFLSKLTYLQKQIAEKAFKIILEKYIKKKYVSTCLEASICPECGEILSYIAAANECSDGEVYCSVDKSHYHQY